LKIITECPFCGYVEEVDEVWVDRRKRCGKCSNLFSVPSIKKLSPAARIIKEAKGQVYINCKGDIYG
jgi:hypothetical protein